ncbi:8039_t:CDS:2 [Paraglomus brasilianum]|uniref:8039_t:CDS:1 n=1 Tax=Paraglomus brasilianum TaxID=144538 RepID=A0A9N8W6N1_9GLOM|nr:8039_t:CDS:2 [Paraglomus brasilianum]
MPTRMPTRPQIKEPLILFIFIVVLIFALKPPTHTISTLSPLERRAAVLRRQDPQVSGCGGDCPASPVVPETSSSTKPTTTVTAASNEILVTTTETITTTIVSVIPATTSTVMTTNADGQVTITEVYVPPRTTTEVKVVTGVRTYATPNPQLQQKGEAIRLGGILWTTVIVGFVSFFVVLLAM